MTSKLAILTILMWAATYPWRAVPLLSPGIDRLPPRALTYLRLVGPAVLTSLAAANTVLTTHPDGTRTLHLGTEAVGVLLCIALVAWRRNLLLGLTLAIAVVAVARAVGRA